MKPALVLGLGNRLMMDDGIGVAVVEALARQHEPSATPIRFEVGETDFAYCLDLAADHDRLIIVDAAQTGRAPGEVVVLPLRDLAARGRGLSMHQMHFLDFLHHLQLAERGSLIGIEPFAIDVHYGLSDVLRAQFDHIVHRVRSAVEEAMASEAAELEQNPPDSAARGSHGKRHGDRDGCGRQQ